MSHSTTHPRRKDERSQKEAAQGQRVLITIVASFVILALLLIAYFTLL